MNYEWLAVAMFVGFFFILMSGYPVAFSFVGAALLFGAIGPYDRAANDEPIRRAGRVAPSKPSDCKQQQVKGGGRLAAPF